MQAEEASSARRKERTTTGEKKQEESCTNPAQKKTARRADGPEVFWEKVSEHEEKDGQHGDGHGDRIPFAGR